jgi:aminopeptidase N
MYIKSFQYSNAVTEDLWNCFSKASSTDISAVMNDWVQYAGMQSLIDLRVISKGHPILKVECISYDNTTKQGVYEISQYLDGSAHNNSIKINEEVKKVKL